MHPIFISIARVPGRPVMQELMLEPGPHSEVQKNTCQKWAKKGPRFANQVATRVRRVTSRTPRSGLDNWKIPHVGVKHRILEGSSSWCHLNWPLGIMNFLSGLLPVFLGCRLFVICVCVISCFCFVLLFCFPCLPCFSLFILLFVS